MDNQRLILFVALSLVILLIFNAWQEQHKAKPVPVAEQTTPAAPKDVPLAVPETPAPEAKIPTTEAVTPSPAEKVATKTMPEEVGETIHVATDLLKVDINTIGGEIRRVSLPTYPVSLKEPNVPVQLLNDTLPNFFVAQSGLLASQGTAPDHHARFVAEKTDYQLADGKDEIKVRLHWKGDDGVSVIKTYTFHRGSFVINQDIEVDNNTQQAWKGRVYRQFQRTEMARKSHVIYTFTGGVVSSSWNKYEKIKYKNMATWKPEQNYDKGGWVAMLRHYFLGAWIPAGDEADHFYTKALPDGHYLLGMSSEERTVAPGNNIHFSSRLYTGPKDQKRMEKVEHNLRLTVDYGILDILARPLFWLMSKIHTVLGNWGLTIIAITILIKLLFFPLSAASYKSMANMKRLAPKLQQLKERYGDDRQKQSQAMMEIYKKEKINPLGGCLPIVIQIPVFIALYWVLLGSVELRQTPFYLWIHDLSTKDPYYVLPVLMGISMFIQQKLNPPPMDPIQQKVMQALPIVFTLFFAFFPAGLVLYWIVNNTLSIAQQWYITRKMTGGQAGKAG
jgi:YidC/Oxa1 family membrane protein insertase